MKVKEMIEKLQQQDVNTDIQSITVLKLFKLIILKLFKFFVEYNTVYLYSVGFLFFVLFFFMEVLFMIRTFKRNITSRRFESRRIRNEANDGNVIYVARRVEFTQEEDSYTDGILLNGGYYEWVDTLNIEASSLDELFKKIKKALYMDSSKYSWAVELSYMNNQSCICVEYEGDKDSTPASEGQINAWKRGEEQLFLVRGRIPVLKTVKASNVPDEEMEALAQKNDMNIF